MDDKRYYVDFGPELLQLLGPNLYTNIYYVLGEIIANAYDADAQNVYILYDTDKNTIIVEDDGTGMTHWRNPLPMVAYTMAIAVTLVHFSESVQSWYLHPIGRRGFQFPATRILENRRSGRYTHRKVCVFPVYRPTWVPSASRRRWRIVERT